MVEVKLKQHGFKLQETSVARFKNALFEEFDPQRTVESIGKYNNEAFIKDVRVRGLRELITQLKESSQPY